MEIWRFMRLVCNRKTAHIWGTGDVTSLTTGSDPLPAARSSYSPSMTLYRHLGPLLPALSHSSCVYLRRVGQGLDLWSVSSLHPFFPTCLSSTVLLVCSVYIRVEFLKP